MGSNQFINSATYILVLIGNSMMVYYIEPDSPVVINSKKHNIQCNRNLRNMVDSYRALSGSQ